MVFFKHDKPHLDVAREIFDYSKKHHEESEAIIKLALLIMHCDENITNSEIDLLDRIIAITRYDLDENIANYVSSTRLIIMDILQDAERIYDFIDRCIADIKTPVIRHSLVKMAEVIANSDNDYAIIERDIIAYLKERIADG